MNGRRGISTVDVIIAVVVIAAVAAGAVLVVHMEKTGRRGSGLGGAFDYSLTDLGRIDPDRIVYRLVKTIDTELDATRALAIGPDGALHVATGKILRTYPKPLTDASHQSIDLDLAPEALAVGPYGSIFIADRAHVRVLAVGGFPRITWPSPGPDTFITAVAVMGEHVYLADAATGTIIRCDSTGKVLGRIGKRDSERNIPGINSLNKHLDVSAAPDGLLRVANTGRLAVEAYTFEGDLEHSFGKGGRTLADFCGCCNPVNIAVQPDGTIVTAEKGYRRVKVYSPKGDLLGAVAAPDAFPDRSGSLPGGQGAGPTPVLDVAVSADGVIWVLDTNSGIVRAFARKDAP